MDANTLKSKFRALYKTDPILVKSPGRINIIGEHTDYNNGFVLPGAIDKAIYVTVSARADDEIHLFAQHGEEHYITSLNALEPSKLGWPNYILGVADQLKKRNYQIGGFNLCIDGDVPSGAGLSSSAAVECATALALDQLFGLSIARIDLAFIGQQAEHSFAGVNCGIMDQFASVFGKKNQVVLLDCRSMEYQYVPLDMDGYTLVLINSNVKHALADTGYNDRRRSCELGVAWVQEFYPQVRSLRDVDLEMLEQIVRPRSADVFKKCRFVVEENARVLHAVEKLRHGDLAGLGQLMFQTHEGLSRSYEVSCTELDFLVNAVQANQAVLGARMMGGGFGGCTLNIIRDDAVNALKSEITNSYINEFGHSPDFYVVKTGEGT
ncbi:MAG: galactokinase, partial [Chryseobacterium sp.]